MLVMGDRGSVSERRLCGAVPMLLDGEGADAGRQAEMQARNAALAEGSAALRARQGSHREASTPSGQTRSDKLTSLTIEAVRDTVTAFFHGMPKACANCGAEVPDINRLSPIHLFGITLFSLTSNP